MSITQSSVINEEPPKYNDISKYTLCKIKKNNVEYELKFSLNPSNDELYSVVPNLRPS
jgi:hypothetical protein